MPLWQPGDSDVFAWEINSIGWTHGSPTNRRDNAGIRGTLYLTGARVLVVSDNFVHGHRYRPYVIGTEAIVDAVATKISQVRATRAAQGTFLVGQMRMPWIKGVVFGGPNAPKNSRGAVRLIGEHVTSFGDAENVMLLMRLRQQNETLDFVRALTERIRQDRLDRPGISDETIQDLGNIPAPESIATGPNELPQIRYSGAFRIRPDTVSKGVRSALSYPGA
jgi:hypothetical protein